MRDTQPAPAVSPESLLETTPDAEGAWIPVGTLRVPLPAPLRALRHRNFRLFWTGQLISLVGTWMQTIARGWLVLELTHSPFWLGMVGFATSVPVLVLSLWAGAVADNVSRRRMVIWTQSCLMLGALILALLTFTGTVQVWHVLAISLFVGVATAFDTPARQALMVELVGKEDLMNAVALNSTIFNGARVVGPTVGALVLAWQGPAMAFFLNGLSYIAVIIGLLRIKLPPFIRKPQMSGHMQRVLEGLRYVRHHDTLAVLMVLVAVVSVFAFPYTVLMPVFADSVLGVGEQGYGTLMAASGIGSLIGALSLAVQSARPSMRRGRIIITGAVLMPVFLGIFALSTNFLLSLAMLVGVGWTMISVNATTNTVIQTTVPDELRGRVSGVYSFLFIGMAPLGNLQAGLLADRIGAPLALAVGAVVTGLTALYVLVRKRQVLALS
jgi:MFS family permease